LTLEEKNNVIQYVEGKLTDSSAEVTEIAVVYYILDNTRDVLNTTVVNNYLADKVTAAERSSIQPLRNRLAVLEAKHPDI